ncbi:hypothetical protein [Mycobacterium leprae]|uniref:U650ad n=2 Tax=Mycobacterium leprae TaxID=1769 RepID=Q50128_MYCLR|nr:hypothetical protein [Mycobacterium leprae]AAA63048.1 u650ad [Mycobacterium leprae]OAR21367.1 hypothetical protein A8144_06675 [Mycobacterium leprae 3125609]OAX71496.1 hypothetical protein A3216_05195 [Mycobacterium leprae 7935681]
MLLPEEIGIIMLTNVAPYGTSETLTAEFIYLLYCNQIRQNWAVLSNHEVGSMNNPEGMMFRPTAPSQLCSGQTAERLPRRVRQWLLGSGHS